MSLPPTLPLRHLGKLAPRDDPRTLHLAKYLAAPTMPPPLSVRLWTPKVKLPFPMAKNDVLGDCTAAAAAHHVQTWNANQGRQLALADEAIVAFYSASSGYDPLRPETDGGAVMLDVLKAWRSVGIGGHPIGAFAAVSPLSRLIVMDAVNLFGGLYVGLALPLSAQTQDGVWEVPVGGAHGRAERGSWGGHAVAVLGYDWCQLWFVSWGEVRSMTWGFFKTYCDEAFAIVSRDFLNQKLVTPNGFDLATLLADLARISS